MRQRVNLLRSTLHPSLYGGARKTWRIIRGGCDKGLVVLRSYCGRPTFDIARFGGIGDVLMCTPGLRELKRKNPKVYIRFYTNHTALVRGLPYIDEVLE